MSDEYVHFNNNTQPAINEDNLNRMQQLIKQDINGAVAGDTLPIGAFMPYAGAVAPTNWLICDGSAVSRTTYRDLFNILGTTFGAGDGSTTFNLPDMRLRTAVGVDTRDSDLNAVGKTYGEKNHTLTKNELPANIIDTANTGSNTDGYIARAGYTKTGSYDFGGAGQPFNVMQPSMATNYIIKAFQTAGVVASIVNAHSTSTTNVYSASYVNGISDYSTTEKVCGTWIDGKPIYRKVVTISSTAFSKGNNNIAHGISDLKMCVNVRGFSSTGTILPYMNLSNDNNSISTFTEISNVDSTNIKIRIANDNWGAANVWYVILDYTKTTD